MSDTVTVKWRGCEVTVEMLATSLPWRRESALAQFTLIRTDRDKYSDLPPIWSAEIEMPAEFEDGEGQRIGFSGEGPTAQEAVDALQTKLDTIARWARGEGA